MIYSKTSDSGLVAAHLAGDANAIPEIAHRYREALIESLTIFVGNAEAAEYMADAVLADSPYSEFDGRQIAMLGWLIWHARNRFASWESPAYRAYKECAEEAFETSDAEHRSSTSVLEARASQLMCERITKCYAA